MNNKGWFETVIDQSPAIGFLLLALLGGIVAHIRKYEQSGKELTWQQHVLGCLRKVIVAVLASFLVYQAWVALSWPIPWGFVVAGIVTVFASEAFDFAWDKLKGLANERVPTGSVASINDISKKGKSDG